jgi:hypothetical protein
MSSLPKILRFADVLLSLALGFFMGIVKLIVFFFEDDDTDAPISSPGMPMGKTTLGTIEPVVTSDEYGDVGSMSGQSIIRHL